MKELFKTYTLNKPLTKPFILKLCEEHIVYESDQPSESYTSNQIELNISEFLCMHVCFKNITNSALPAFSLQIKEHSPLRYQHNSLKDELTGAYLLHSSNTSDEFKIGPIAPSGELHLSFYAITDLTTLNEECLMRPLELMIGKNEDHIPLSEPHRYYGVINHAIVDIVENHRDGIISITNNGIRNTKRLLYKYKKDDEYVPDFSNYSARLNDTQIKLAITQLDQYVLFDLPDIPGKLENIPPTLVIRFKTKAAHGIRNSMTLLC